MYRCGEKKYVDRARMVNAEYKPTFDDLFVRTRHYARSCKLFIGKAL